jgi:CubicO group peptidase (beta-lactamase class C family)
MKIYSFKIFIFLALLVLSACDEIKRIKDIPLGTGHSAHDLCSRIFVSNQTPELIIEDVLVQKVYPLQWIWKVAINSDAKTVSVGAPFFLGLNNATAIYQEARGCTLLKGRSIESLNSNTISAIEAPFVLADDQYWPDGALGVHPDSKNYNLKAIELAIDKMFVESFQGRFKQFNTYAVLVAHKGKLIAERYSPGHTEDMRLLGWSISKSVTALLLGIHYKDGKINLEDPVHLKHKADPELRLKHVFNMASGLDFDEGYKTQSDIANMLYVSASATDYVKARPFLYEPGTVFNYSTGDTQILSDIVTREAGGSAQSAYEFYQQKLFHKLSIANAVVEHDVAGTFIGGARMFMRPRDWAKIGLLMANKGQWKGETIVPEEWIDEMLAPSPANKYYGGQVWLYDPEVFGEKFPSDAYALWGVLGQLVVVVPSLDLLVVRMGANGSELPEDIERDTVFKPALEIIQSLPSIM